MTENSPYPAPGTCRCHIFDTGPRCEACVKACAAAGHPEVGFLTNGQPHRCGVVLGGQA